MYRTSGHFPYYRDAQYPPLYFHPAAHAIDLAQYRLASGILDENREREMSLFLSSSGFKVPGYDEAPLGESKLNSVNAHITGVIAAMGVDIPAYAQATNHSARAEALLSWLKEQEGYLLKPMNCPHHIQIYKATPHSYRDLPVRLAEFGTVYRYEQAGELNGMTRVRGFTQDDAHLFIKPEDVEPELISNIELVLFILEKLNLTDYRVRVGLRDPGSNKYVGSPELWSNAEKTLLAVVQKLGMNYSAEPGEAAFYGPKIDFVVRDCIGREWQLGTVQLDYNLPERFQLEYVGADNLPHRPVMIHRAPFGSMERFCGILIEHFAGAFPLWLAPEQGRVIPLRDTFNDYAKSVEKAMRERGLRVVGDYRHEDMRNKIREAQLEKIPYMLVVGGKEQEAGTVAIRDRIAGDMGAKPLVDVIAMFEEEVRTKRIREVSKGGASVEGGAAKFAG
jgi:threonyl-tRNA synthetase